MRHSSNYAQMVSDLIAAKAEIMALPLVKDAQGDKSRYIRLVTLLSAIEPILLEHGIILVQGQGESLGTDGVMFGISIETTLLHRSGEWISSEVAIPVAGPLVKGGGRGPVGPQDGGVSNTYARRYGIFNVLSISVDEDTDGAVRTAARRKRARALAEEIAESVAEKTQERTDALREQLARFVTTEEPCMDCRRAKGQRHADGCPNALLDRMTADRPAIGAGGAEPLPTPAKADARPVATARYVTGSKKCRTCEALPGTPHKAKCPNA